MDMIKMKMALGLIKDEQDEAWTNFDSLAPSTGDKAVRAANKIHSAWCECDLRERKIFFEKFGQLTIMEVVEIFGDNDEVSAKLPPEFRQKKEV
tara:strand:+ start:224 stop:505 length:282 start_codon:yes stop_codon:yes gene_type:complete